MYRLNCQCTHWNLWALDIAIAREEVLWTFVSRRSMFCMHLILQNRIPDCWCRNLCIPWIQMGR